MTRRFGAEHDEVQAAMERHAAEDAKGWREDQRDTEMMWRTNERRRQAEAGARRPHGHFQFTELRNENGGTVGWNAKFNNHPAGMLILHPASGDLICLASGDSSQDSPSATDILAAFIHLYPAQRSNLPPGHPLLRE